MNCGPNASPPVPAPSIVQRPYSTRHALAHNQYPPLSSVLHGVLSPHSSSLSPRFWAVGPSALPCAGGFPPQRPPLASDPAFSSPATSLAACACSPTCRLQPLTTDHRSLTTAVQRPPLASDPAFSSPATSLAACACSSTCCLQPLTTDHRSLTTAVPNETKLDKRAALVKPDTALPSFAEVRFIYPRSLFIPLLLVQPESGPNRCTS